MSQPEPTQSPGPDVPHEQQPGSRIQLQAVEQAMAVALQAIRARRLDYEAANHVLAALITLHRALSLPLTEARKPLWWSAAVYAGTPETSAPPSAVRIAAGRAPWPPEGR
jgi:type II secretory pathway pseudopilin PulG